MVDGNKFIEMGHLFQKIHEEKRLTSDNLVFTEAEIAQADCGTVACHGGWGAVIFGLDPGSDFKEGADAIAEFLGFDYYDDFEQWATSNPHYWGNKFGFFMFCCDGYWAFGFEHYYDITVNDIGKHYIGVGERINEAQEKN